jgi:Fe2+ or Zn2+ uptake regulation protein
MTSQRMKILEYLKSVKTHPNAEDIYNHVKKDLPAITLATVYRNLNLLAEQGKILKLEINKELRFDADMCCHQHCVCRKCGKIIDMHSCRISEYAIKNFKSKEFRPECVTIIYKGLCRKCWGE